MSKSRTVLPTLQGPQKNIYINLPQRNTSFEIFKGEVGSEAHPPVINADALYVRQSEIPQAKSVGINGDEARAISLFHVDPSKI